MTHCTRYEEEGLEQETLPEELRLHMHACAECQQAQTSYENLCQLLRQSQMPVTMPADWKEKVRQAVGAPQAVVAPKEVRKKQSPSLWERWCALMSPFRWGLVGATTAALVALLFVQTNVFAPTTVSGPAAFEWNVFDVASSQIRSADRAKLGSQIHVQAQVAPASHAALFVYLQNRLVFACSTAAPGEHCQKTDNMLKAQVLLEQLGLYRALWVVSSKPLPLPQEGFDLDAAAFLRMGANIQHPFAVEVY